jgi:D-amino peptidase
MRLLLALLLSVSLCAAEPYRVVIITDLEGVGGVNNAEEQLLPGQRRYEESRKLLAGEVNAAVAGALEGGAGEVVIFDGHDGSRTLSVDIVHPRAKLLQGRPTPATYYFGEKLYDGILFVGQHAMAGAKEGVLAHTQNFQVAQLTLNGKPVGEIGQAAAIGGHFEIPVIMLSGDQAACEEIRDIQPGAVTVAVKQKMGKGSTLSLSHPEACRRIQDAARQAVTHVREYKPWKVQGPVELRFLYQPEKPGTPGRTLTYRGATVLEAFQEWLGR